MIRRFLTVLTSISSALLLASCSPIFDSRGHSLEDADFKQIVPGQSSPADVTALLGSASARSNYGDETWYYITEKIETVGMFAPEVIDQKVIAVRFDADHHVVDITTHTKDEGEDVQFVDKSTPTEGQHLTIMEQLLGNVGRFAGPGHQIDPREGH